MSGWLQLEHFFNGPVLILADEGILNSSWVCCGKECSSANISMGLDPGL